jgi:hypothetical protein
MSHAASLVQRCGGDRLHEIWIEYFTKPMRLTPTAGPGESEIDHFLSALKYSAATIKEVRSTAKNSQGREDFEQRLAKLFRFSEFPLPAFLAITRLLSTQRSEGSTANAAVLPDVVMRGFLCLSYHLPSLLIACAEDRAVPSFPVSAWNSIQFPFLYLMNQHGPLYKTFFAALDPYLATFTQLPLVLRLPEAHPLRHVLQTILSVVLPFFRKALDEGSVKLLVFVLDFFASFLESSNTFDCPIELVRLWHGFFQLCEPIIYSIPPAECRRLLGRLGHLRDGWQSLAGHWISFVDFSWTVLDC